MLISEHFQYQNNVFQSDIFVSDIGIPDVDVGCRISPTLRSMSMPTYSKYTHPQVGWGGGGGMTCRHNRLAHVLFFGNFGER